LLFVKLAVIFLLFGAFDQHNQRRWPIVIYYHAFHPPDGATLFCIINVLKMAFFSAKNSEDSSSISEVIS